MTWMLTRRPSRIRSKCISLLEYFDFRNHICLVTPLLGQSVFDFLKGNSFQPFPEAHIQSFAKDLLTSLSCESCEQGNSTRTCADRCAFLQSYIH